MAQDKFDSKRGKKDNNREWQVESRKRQDWKMDRKRKRSAKEMNSW